jgi:hypothetical protein
LERQRALGHFEASIECGHLIDKADARGFKNKRQPEGGQPGANKAPRVLSTEVSLLLYCYE